MLLRITRAPRGERPASVWRRPAHSSTASRARGARTGVRRRNAIIYFHDGDRVTIAASNAGAANHPAWYYNLRADPDVTFGGIPMRATVITDPARNSSWGRVGLAHRVFPTFANYRRDAVKAKRTIPIVQLTPSQPADVTNGQPAPTGEQRN